MRRVVSFAFVSMLLMFLVVPAQGQGLSGTWVLTYARAARGGGAATEVTQEFTFKTADDGTITGTTMMAMGGRGARGGAAGAAAPAPQETPLSDVKLEGNKLTFAVNMTMGDRTISTTYAATVTGNAMEGTFTRGGAMGGAGGAATPTPFKAVKKQG